jgi:hypothetical protein
MSQQVGTEVDVQPFRPSAGEINILGKNFIDSRGRILHLRGANVGAASKVYVGVWGFCVGGW